MRMSSCMCVVGLICFAFTQRSGAREPAHRAEVGPFYVVKWDRAYNLDTKVDGGDVVLVYQCQDDRFGVCRRLKQVYKYSNGGGYVDSVAAWNAPMPIEGDYPSVTGVLLTLIGGAGSGRTFVILAKTKRGFRPVFDQMSDRVGGRSLEMVDLDGDSYQEIVYVPDYREVPIKAQVWKWSSKRERYVKVRETRYSDRLKPFKRTVKRPRRMRH